MKIVRWWKYWHGLDSPLGNAIPVLLMVLQIALLAIIVAPPLVWVAQNTIGPWWKYWLG